MDISIRGLILFVIIAAGAVWFDMRVLKPGTSVKFWFRILCGIAMFLVVLHLFGFGPGVRVH